MPEGFVDGLSETLARFVGNDAPQLLAQESVKRFRQLSGHSAVLVDQQPAEEGLVEESSDVWVGVAVGGVAVACQLQSPSQVVLYLLEVPVDSLKAVLGPLQLGSDSGLLGLEEVKWDCPRIVGFEELLLFAPELLDAAALGLSLPFGSGVHLGEFVSHELFDVLTLLVRQLDGSVVGRHGLLDLIDQQSPLVAARPTLLAP